MAAALAGRRDRSAEVAGPVSRERRQRSRQTVTLMRPEFLASPARDGEQSAAGAVFLVVAQFSGAGMHVLDQRVNLASILSRRVKLSAIVDLINPL